MTLALVSLGANLGNSHAAVNLAAGHLIDSFGLDHVRLSSLLTSPPIGGPRGQDSFFNAVAAIETNRTLFDFWHVLREIETQLGRERRQRWESRRIDLDILMFGDTRLWTPHLKIPHPRMVTRSFAILPAAELSPDVVEPVSKMTLYSLADRLGYQYEPKRDSLELKTDTAVAANEVIVLCKGRELEQELSAKIVESSVSRFHVRFTSFGKEDGVREGHQTLQNMLSEKTALLVFAMECPDPTVIAWEDYSRKYAQWLGFDGSGDKGIAKQTLSFPVPKYLLNCADLSWAVHELSAALSAMRCELTFAKPGWALNLHHE